MHTPRLALIALTASAATSGSLAFASPASKSPQQQQLAQTCSATLASIQKATAKAASSQRQPVQAIVSRLTVVTPGDLSAQLSFNRAGSSIHLAQERSSFGMACGQTAGQGHGLGPGRSRVVSTLHEHFNAPGSYTLTFRLNQAGRTILAQLGAAQRAYRRQHPGGHHPPGIAYAVSLQFGTGG